MTPRSELTPQKRKKKFEFPRNYNTDPRLHFFLKKENEAGMNTVISPAGAGPLPEMMNRSILPSIILERVKRRVFFMDYLERVSG